MRIVDVPGYEGIYAIDEAGDVFSYKFGNVRKLKPGKNNWGYLYVLLRKDRKAERFYVHRLMAKAFLSNYSDDLVVDHIDRNKTNNKLSNLQCVTPQQNQFNRDAKGFCWNKRECKWQAQIMRDRKQIHLGYFNKEEDAREAYLAAKQIYHVIT